MQTITGQLRMVGASNTLASAQIQIKERWDKKEGNILATLVSNGSGEFSFQIHPGAYFLRIENDVLPFTVKETAGSTTIGSLIEAL